jgi:hypothetical protein
MILDKSLAFDSNGHFTPYARNFIINSMIEKVDKVCKTVIIKPGDTFTVSYKLEYDSDFCKCVNCNCTDVICGLCGKVRNEKDSLPQPDKHITVQGKQG